MIATEERVEALDELLFDVCESLQLTETQHQKAVDRYQAISRVLDGPDTPFTNINSNLYPQGSMRLGTTVKPIEGPHDLDFVCEFEMSHTRANPMSLLRDMFEVFRRHGVYGGMVTLKKRCVRVTYADEFYLDILPACRNYQSGGTCIQVPDRDTRWWTPSNPISYAIWFENATQRIRVQRHLRKSLAMDSAASIQPIPNIQATEEKTVLQLVVQLLKRWRDIHYSDSSFPPISIVLTTLAARHYRGERDLCTALGGVLDRIVADIDAAHSRNHRLEVRNPVHYEEDFSERWKNTPGAYLEFVDGMQRLALIWGRICKGIGNPNADLERLFGEVINNALLKRARNLQDMRSKGALGITSAGTIVPVQRSVAPILRNTNHGA